MLLAYLTVMLVRNSIRTGSVVRRRAVTLLISFPFPWLGNILYIFNLNPYPGLDLTLVGFAIAGVILFWGVNRLGLVELSPIARDTLVETMNEGIMVVDWNDRVMEFNRAVIRLVEARGYEPPPPLLGRTLTDLSKEMPDLAPMFQAQAESTIIIPAIIIGEPILEVTQQGIKDRDGHLSGRVFILRDITAQKQAEDTLLRQQRMLATEEERLRMGRELHDSLGQVLHYINIQSKAIQDMLERGDIPPAAASLAQLINVSQEANVNVRSFIQDTRPLIIPQKAFMPALMQYIDHFRELTGLPVLLNWAGIDFETVLTTTAKLQVLRIIQEALSNIRKHAQATSIQIGFSQRNELLNLVIADNGIGFNPEETISSDHYGLQIIRERARAAGGSVEILSQPGKGTEIRLSLPIAPNPDIIELKKYKFMIVDDHPLILEALRNLFSAKGLEVIASARSGEEALELIKNVSPDIIIMDVKMPGLSGPQTTAVIKKSFPHVKVMMLSMSDREEDLSEALQSGTNAYLLKSEDPDHLFGSLKRMLTENLVISEEMTRRTIIQRSERVTRPLRIEPSPTIYNLSPRELDILERVAHGEGYKEIGAALHLSPHTIKYHFNKILETMQITSRSEAIQVAIQSGLIKGKRITDPQF